MPLSKIFRGNELELQFGRGEASCENALHCVLIRTPIIRSVHGWQDSPQAG